MLRLIISLVVMFTGAVIVFTTIQVSLYYVAAGGLLFVAGCITLHKVAMDIAIHLVQKRAEKKKLQGD
jgi:hypothetical protein